jgi:hypothetical protein
MLLGKYEPNRLNAIRESCEEVMEVEFIPLVRLSDMHSQGSEKEVPSVGVKED